MFTLFDSQAGGISLVLIALLESIGIGWFYGKYIAANALIQECKREMINEREITNEQMEVEMK